MKSPLTTDDTLDRRAPNSDLAAPRNTPYDLLSFGGGSCPKVVGRHAIAFGWDRICFLTNGSDNGGSTQKIVEALRPDYGPTVPVGDITSGLIGLMPAARFEIMNMRGWKLDPSRFGEDEQTSFAATVVAQSTFTDRLACAINVYRRHDIETVDDTFTSFAERLLTIAHWVDECGLIRAGVPGLGLHEASVRHHIFNAVMIRSGAYDTKRKSVSADHFRAGLALLCEHLDIPYDVYPCSVDEQVLYAEWHNTDGAVMWSTIHTSSDLPVINVGGQVALSNAPDTVKAMPDGGIARIGAFGFAPDRPQPTGFADAVNAIARVEPGAPIVYGPSSFVASIAPCLAVSGIPGAIAERTDCPRILFLNLTLNNETLDWRVSDFLDFWERNTGMAAARTIDYIVANNDCDSTTDIRDALSDKGDSLETFKFRGPLTLDDTDRNAVQKRGITVVEAPLACVKQQLMRLSSVGEREFTVVPNHDSRRLMIVCRFLVDDFRNRFQRQKDRKCVSPDNEPWQAVIHYPQ